MAFRTLDGVAVRGKRVLLRADLNVPVRDGKISDLTRIERLSPTIRELAGNGAKVIVCSHFDRPKGKRVPEMSLGPVAVALGQVLGSKVRFAEDCVGLPAQQAVERMRDGDVIVLGLEEENQRLDYLNRHLSQILPTVIEMESLKQKIQLNGHFKKLPGVEL